MVRTGTYHCGYFACLIQQPERSLYNHPEDHPDMFHYIPLILILHKYLILSWYILVYPGDITS